MSQDPIERLLATLEPPRPPEELRARVLSRARAALAAPAPRGLCTRLFESRPLRLGWGAAVALLVAGHVVVSIARRPESIARSAGPRALPPRGDGDLASVVRLPRIDGGARPLAGAKWERRSS
jgi:hypothetical protein